MALDTVAVSRPFFGGLSLRSSVRWLWTAGCAVLDQGLFSLSNFAVNIVLARWLAPKEYGAFTMVYTLFLVFGTVHTALLAEPMIVFGPAKYRDRVAAYVTVLSRGHWLLTGLGSATLGLAAAACFFTGERALAVVFGAAAAVCPLLLLLWLMRRACYIRIGPHLAASGSLFYMIVLVIGSYALLRTGYLSPATALILMGGGSLVSAVWLRTALGLQTARPDPAFTANVFSDHWGYGKWAVGTGVLGALMLNVYYVVLPVTSGLEDAGTLRALTNLVMPATQTFYALSVVTVPALVRRKNTPAFSSAVRRLLWLYGCAAMVYWLGICFAHRWLVELVYNNHYTNQSWMLWLLGLVPFTTAGVSIFESGLRSLERSDDIFRAYLLSAAVTVGFSLPAMYLWGVTGAIAGLLISSSVTVGWLAASLRTRMKEQVAVTEAAHA